MLAELNSTHRVRALDSSGHAYFDHQNLVYKGEQNIMTAGERGVQEEINAQKGDHREPISSKERPLGTIPTSSPGFNRNRAEYVASTKTPVCHKKVDRPWSWHEQKGLWQRAGNELLSLAGSDERLITTWPGLAHRWLHTLHCGVWKRFTSTCSSCTAIGLGGGNVWWDKLQPCRNYSTTKRGNFVGTNQLQR